MGINGLWNTIAPIGESKSLLAFLVAQKVELQANGNSRPILLGVDMRPFMAECVAAASAPSVSGRWAGGEIYILFNKLAHYLRTPATFVFVFDGPGRPAVKRGTNVIQREPHWTKLAKELIGYFGYYTHQAPGEAEAELAMLNRSGLINGIITSDGDTLIFGALILLRTIPFKKKKFDDETILFTSNALEAIGLTKAGLILFALLCGGDYGVGILGCGAETAHGLARSGFGDSLLEAVEELGPEELLKYLISWRVQMRHELSNNPRKLLSQRQPHIASLITDTFPDLNILSLYHHPLTSWSLSVQSIPDATVWISKEPDIYNLAKFGSNVFQWDTEAKLKSKFAEKIWSGVFLQMVYSKYMLYDDARKLLSTPAMQATIIQISFEARKGKHAAITGPERQLKFRVSTENFVRLMSSSFTSGPADIVTVWPPKYLLPEALQTASTFKQRFDRNNPMGERREHGKGKGKAHTAGEEGSASAEGGKEPAAEVRWLGFFDWTDLDKDEGGPSNRKRSLESDDFREGTAKRTKERKIEKIEIIDLTNSD